MKPLLDDIQWVTFYCDLSDELLEHMLGPNANERFVQDGSGDEVYTDDAQDAFEEIVAIVESHMYDTFRRVGDDDE
jgi:hypothetical protein